MKARVLGVRSYMRLFKSYYGCMLIMRYTDDLRPSIENLKLTAINTQELAWITVQSLKCYCTDHVYCQVRENRLKKKAKMKLTKLRCHEREKLQQNWKWEITIPTAIHNNKKPLQNDLLRSYWYCCWCNRKKFWSKTLSKLQWWSTTEDISHKLKIICTFYDEGWNKFNLPLNWRAYQ